ncbi:hypothetical protein F383_05616 [Gossypium arboreum]|uniref:Uncharacterized protein n=1 Tax=Gossypium arboreum TaxID=29729 RepID=A0A0B0NYI6_GOSAR|nr:hypothetical protein F383_05616 [Gossypium arboreum]
MNQFKCVVEFEKLMDVVKSSF